MRARHLTPLNLPRSPTASVTPFRRPAKRCCLLSTLPILSPSFLFLSFYHNNTHITSERGGSERVRVGMAKTEGAGKEEEEQVKAELVRAVRAVVEGGNRDALDTASRAIAELRKGIGMTWKPEVPEAFLCPISGDLMRDPVLIASGQTFDRPYIQAWLNAGNRTCPNTQQVLGHTIITPNHLVHRMISEWCKDNGILLPPIENRDVDIVTAGERCQLENLLEKISLPSIAEKKKATKELRLLTRRLPSFRALLGEKPDVISQLLSLLALSERDQHPDLQEDAVTTILNLSILDDNKKIVGDNPQAIPVLISVLKRGTMEARSNAAAALFTLSALDENKLKIGKMGAISLLLKLLEQGSPIAKKDAASAIFNLCVASDNKSRAVTEGAVTVLLKCITEAILVDECLTILAMLAGNHQAVEQLCDNNGLHHMLDIIRDNNGGRNRENAVVILYSICMYDRSKLWEVREEENCNACISWLAENGTSRARRKATGILERLKRLKGSPFATP